MPIVSVGVSKLKNYTICFREHRKVPPGQVDALARRLRLIIIKLIEDGNIYFLTGGALGFDTLAAQTILALRTNYPHIQLILALPCVSQANKWSSTERTTYEEIRKSADKVIYISKEHTRGCMHKRNRYLADSSSVCVCYLIESTGGTAYTVSYARKKKLLVINVAEK